MTDLVDRLKTALASRYAIERELGRGGMAVVFLAHDQKLDRGVAIKVLRPELAASLGAGRFLREIEIAAKLIHPNILALYDCGEADGLLYYVMPYVEGETLRDRLTREKQLPIDDALKITREVADALGHAHSLGIVHRDIKPGNIMFTAGHAVVSDFGIARAVSEAGVDSLTQTGLAVGTPAYMSPEQATGSADIDSRSDLYSLGCVLYEMLSGESPYTATTSQSLIAKKLNEPTPRVSVVRDTVRPATESALLKAMAKTPADRFGTAQELAAALDEDPRVNVPSRVHGSQRKGPAIWIGATVALMVITVGSWMLVRSPPGDGAGVESIIVLPVEASDGDSVGVVVAEVLTLNINSALSKIEGVSVKGVHSASRYLDEQVSDAEILRDLGVDALLRTTLLRYGDRVQVFAALYDEEGSILWSDEYDHEPQDIVNLPAAVARGIASGIEIDLTSSDEAQLAPRDVVDPEAYQAYAFGHHFWTQRGDGLRIGKGYFERAIALDSTFADAWAGLADAYNLLGFYHLLPPTRAYPRGREAAQRALLLDPGNSRAHTALAAFYGWYDLDPEKSVSEFEAAKRSDPEYWIAYAWICSILELLGRPEEAVSSCEAAVDGDPRYPIVHMAYGWRDWAAGRSERAVPRFRRILDLTPDSPVAHRMLGQALTELGRFDEAESQLRLALAHPAHSSRVEAQLAYLMAATGRQDTARAILEELKRRADEQAGDTIIQSYVSALDIAVAYAGLEQTDSALVWLSTAYDERASELFLIPLDPRFEAMRSDPAFRSLLDLHWRSGDFY